MEAYTYKPLEKSEIRLLNVHSNVGNQPISGSIIHIPLTNPTFNPGTADIEAHLQHAYSYEAVSYTWGTDTRKPFNLIIDGSHTIAVTTHLQSVLQKVVRPNTSVLIWIDAICINQADKDSEEKAQQIRLMPDIYRIAKRVQIHLGPEADDSPLAIKFFEHIAEYAEYLDESLNISNSQAYALAVEKGYTPPEKGDNVWSALYSFWMRPWFRRVWVMQELVNAADIVIHCGDLEIDWKKLWLAARVLKSNHRLIETGLTVFTFHVHVDVYEGVNSFFTMANTRLRAWGYMSKAYMIVAMDFDKTAPASELVKRGLRPHESIPLRRDLTALQNFDRLIRSKHLEDRAAGNAFTFERRDMLSALHSTRTFLATNPVDRLYAMLGLVSGIDINDPDFRVEYSAQQTPAIVCQRFAAGMIKRGQGPAVLGLAGTYAQACQSESDLPSWVPNWTTPIRPNNAFASMNHMMYGLTVAPGKDIGDELLYCAAGNSTMNARFLNDDCTLVIRGARIDIVAYILKGRLSAPPAMYIDILSRIVGPGADTVVIEAALWRTLLLNRTSKGEEAPPDYAAQYLFYKQRLGRALGVALLLLAIIFLISLPLIVVIVKMVRMVYLVLIFTIIFYMGWDTSPLPTSAAIILFRSSSKLAILVGAGILAYRTKDLVIEILPRIDYKWQYLAGFAMSYNLRGPRYHSGPPECADFMESLLPLAGRYNLGVIRNGYLASFPLAARIGDEVVIFEGGFAPFLLRKVEGGDCYKLIGECYVHGIMKGEPWEDVKPHLEDIHIV